MSTSIDFYAMLAGTGRRQGHHILAEERLLLLLVGMIHRAHTLRRNNIRYRKRSSADSAVC
jgi:hypothetical protein